jgi:hypothetical protein
MNLKKLYFSLASILFSGLGWFFFSRIFSSQNIIKGNGGNWLLFFLSLSLSYAFLFIVALAKNRYDFWLTTLINSLWVLVFMGVSAKTLLSALAMFVAAQVLMEFPVALERSLNLRYFTVSYSKIALVILAIIGISSAYVQQRVVQNIGQQGFSENTSNFVWPYIGRYITQFNSEETVNDYVRAQYQSHGVNNPSNYMIDQGRQDISDQVGFEVRGDQKMSDLGKKFVAFKLNDVINNFQIDKAGLYIIFLSLLVLWPIGRMFFAAVSALMYLIFKKSGAIKIVEGQVVTQKLEI